ncbi:MAG: DUF4403 family protein [Pseudomonadota bacterium]
MTSCFNKARVARRPSWPRWRVAAAFGAALSVGGCLETENFTAAPMGGYIDLSADKRKTTLFAATPLDLNTAEVALSGAKRARPTKHVTWLRYGGCVTRGRGRRCYGARVDLTIAAAGSASLGATADGAIELSVPLTYDIKARGLRRARQVRDRVTGVVTARIAFPIIVDGSLAPTLGAPGRVHFEGQAPKVFGRVFDLSGWARAWANQSMRSARTVLTQMLQDAPLKTATERVWVRLQKPVQLTSTANSDQALKRWLIARPIAVVGAGVSVRDGKLYLRSAVEADVHLSSELVHVDDAATAVRALSARDIKFEQDASTETELSLVVSLPVTKLRDDIAKAYAPDTEITSRASVTQPEYRFRLGAAVVSPAQRFFAISIPAEIRAPVRFAGRTGVINLVGRPRLDAKTMTLTVSRVSFPVIADPSKTAPDPSLAFSAAPFAQQLDGLSPIDLSESLTRVTPKIATLFNADTLAIQSGPADGGLRMSSRFMLTLSDAVVPSPKGIDVAARLSGDLMFVYAPKSQQTARRSEPTRANGDIVESVRSLSSE